jgi:hypothetical protein
LADRGFLVSEELAAHGVTLRMPSFTRGKKQLSAICWDNDVNKWSDISYPDIYQYILMENSSL